MTAGKHAQHRLRPFTKGTVRKNIGGATSTAVKKGVGKKGAVKKGAGKAGATPKKGDKKDL